MEPGLGDPNGRDQEGRRRVTILFADFVGFSTLAEHMDPEELQSTIAGVFEELSGVIEEREGRVEKFVGDALMATFGTPIAHEDDPLRALEAAATMRDVVAARSMDLETPLRLRIGINSGLVVAGMVGDGTQAGVMGDAVNVAARLQQAAEPDEIIVSAPVWRRVREEYETVSLGQLEIKGRDQTVSAYRVFGSRRSEPRRQAPFIGRSEEIALLELLWSSASRGNTHVVTVVGEPGVGKSRLLSEFVGRADALDVRVVCEARRPFGLFVDLVERILGGLPSDADELRRRVREFRVDEQTVVALATLLGLGGSSTTTPILEQERRRTYQGIWRMLLAAPRGRPALIVIDDVHRADESSLELLGFLLERLAGTPFLMILAHRPDFLRLDRVSMRPSHTAIRLELLSQKESVALARGYLGVNELPADLEAIIATRAEGNAFFIEELLQALLELGSLAIVGGEVRLAALDLDVPDTVQATIQARIDHLPARERSLLEHASVVGRSFSTDLMEAILQPNLSAAFEGLERAQLLVRRGPDEWAFKHALIQEVAYETLLRQQRREMHRRVADALEARGPEDPLMLEALAEHYAGAEALDKARQYALAAGDAASERMGVVEAGARYRTALRLWGAGDEEGRLRLLMKLGYAELLSADAAAARTVLIEAEAGWRAMGDLRRAGAALALLGRAYFFLGEIDRANEVLHRSVELLQPMGASEDLVRAFVWTSVLNVVKGNADEGAVLASRGLRMAEDLRMPSARSHLLVSLGVFETLSGDPSGLDRIRAALQMAEESDDAEAIGRAFVNLTKMLGELHRAREAQEFCERGRKVLHRLGAASLEWPVAGIQAQMLVELGLLSEAKDLAREMLGPQRRQLVATAIVYAGSALGEALLREGRYAETREVIDELLPSARRVGGSMVMTPTLLLEADLEDARGNAAAARQALAESIDVALGSSAVAHWFRPLRSAARLMPRDEVLPILERVRPNADRDASFDARLTEAEALLAGRDVSGLRRAADLYAALELPYQEARCLVDAGDLDRAAELIAGHGLDEGPLGAALAERRGS